MDSYDETWYSYPLWIAAAVEINLAVLTACAPSLRPLIAIYARPLITSMMSSFSKRSQTSTRELSASTSKALDFDPEERGGGNRMALETIDIKQLPESTSDSSEAAIILDGFDVRDMEGGRLDHALNTQQDGSTAGRPRHSKCRSKHTVELFPSWFDHGTDPPII